MLHAEVRLRARFPEEGRLLPTSLGNALRSAEDRAGRRYGLESVTIWPRLYPLLPAEFRDTLEDEVTQLDVSARLSVTWGATASIAGLLLLTDSHALRSSPVWILVPFGLWVLSWLSYKAAVESALAHGIDLEVAIDLHRSLVLRAMRLPPTTRLSEERRLFKRLSRFFITYDPNHGYELEFVDGPALEQRSAGQASAV
jgi:hypothetical protein